MASFEVNGSLENLIGKIDKFAVNDEIYREMISAGQDIMKTSIESGASKHVVTGHMASSLKKTTPVLDKEGAWVGRVKFTGTDGVYITKDGKKYDMTNWYKAFRIEYGTSKQKAQPFVRPAIRGCSKDINNKWQKIFERELKKLQ